jgi:hypothetical protein
MPSLRKYVRVERLDVAHRSDAGYKEGAHRYLLFSKRVQNLTVRPTHPIRLSISCPRPITKLEARIQRIARTPHDARRAFDRDSSG